jgi:hypothetical protein
MNRKTRFVSVLYHHMSLKLETLVYPRMFMIGLNFRFPGVYRTRISEPYWNIKPEHVAAYANGVSGAKEPRTEGRSMG